MHVTREATKLERYRRTVRSRSASTNLIFLRNEKRRGKKLDDWGLEEGGGSERRMRDESRAEPKWMRADYSADERRVRLLP